MSQPLSIATATGTVSAILERPDDARWLYVLAHGAGAGMRHAFLERLAVDLATRRVATLRYQFPYMEEGRRRPDPPAIAQQTVRAAVAAARETAPALRLIAGGKSFGGRMTSQAQAEAPLDRVEGLVFLGFPLHPPKRPSDKRALHLRDVDIPMLFLQGTRDDLADMTLFRRVMAGLDDRNCMHVVDGADHSFKVLKRSGRTEDEVRKELVESVTTFVDRL